MVPAVTLSLTTVKDVIDHRPRKVSKHSSKRNQKCVEIGSVIATVPPIGHVYVLRS